MAIFARFDDLAGLLVLRWKEHLGFTHICAVTRNGKFQVRRKTARNGLQAKLKEVMATLRRHLNWSIPQMGAYLGAVVRGHTQYFGVPLNSGAITKFRYQVSRLWRWVLGRRSQRTHITWARMQRLIQRYLPPARVCHPFPIDRFVVRTQGRSPVH